MSEVYSKEYIVASGNTDLFDMCRPSSLMNYFQDIANLHSDELGTSRSALIGTAGVVWIMARMYYKLFRPVRGLEKLTIKTWHRRPKASTIYRDFDIFAGDEHVGEAVTMWVVMNIKTHKIMKLTDIELIKNSTPYEGCKTLELSKMRAPENLSDCEKRLMRYSDTDANGHVNNIRYADFTCDALEAHKKPSQYISELHINFSNECFAGEEILIKTGKLEDSDYVSGFDLNGKLRFETLVVMSRV